MIIKAIKKAGANGVALSFDTGERYTLSLDDFISLEIVKGEVTPSLFEKIKDCHCDFLAFTAATRCLAYGQCSGKKLYEKLRGKGFAHAASKKAVEKAYEKGYIDEEWQLESYLRELCEKKLFGRRKAFQYLLAKGYEGNKISEILESKYSDSDFEGFRAQFLKKKFGKTAPKDECEALEMKKALYKQGY